MICMSFGLHDFFFPYNGSFNLSKEEENYCYISYTIEAIEWFHLIFDHVDLYYFDWRIKKKKRIKYDYHSRMMVRNMNFHRIVFINDLASIENIRMDRHSFHQLCDMVRVIGRLEPTKNMGVEKWLQFFCTS